MELCWIGKIINAIGGAAAGLRAAARMRCGLLVALLGLPVFAQDAEDRRWVAPQGSTAITLNRELLRDLGLELTSEQPTAKTNKPRSLAFAVKEDASQIALAHTESVFVEGTVAHQGGVVFTTGSGLSISLIDFQIRPIADSPLLELCDREGRALFTLDHVQVNYQPAVGKLFLLNMDLRLTKHFAQLLERPELEGIAIADLTTELKVGDPVVRSAHGALPVQSTTAAAGLRTDIELTGLTAVQQMARTAGQRVALSLSTTLRNSGEADVPWFWSIAPAPSYAPKVGPHPYLVLHLYRLANGVFEQIGRSDVKHAFYATNTGCGRDGGQVFFPGCSDVYGIGNNADQFYFSPRSEVTAFTGHWQSLGSHFDGLPVNDVRNHDEENDAFTHRLTVAESALQTAGAQYYAEAWYVVAGDVNLTNSMGFRQVTPKLSGNTWSFTFNSSLTAGAAIDVWAGTQPVSNGTGSSAIITGEGLVKVASRTTDLGAGGFRYNYALMNVDFDRQIRSFSIPLLPGSGVTSANFRDGDTNTANDWLAVITAENITWTAPSGGALDWGMLCSFSFLATAGPSTTMAQLGVLETGARDVITGAVARPEPRADLVLSESSAPNPLVDTAQLTYTFAVRNAGPDAASAVVLRDVLPARAIFVAGSSTQGSLRFEDGVATCALGALARDAVATVTITVAPFAKGTLANTASVAAAELDPLLENNFRTALTQIPDTDSDGLPDFFENTNQLAAQNAADGPADLDGDGLTNLQEFETGTNPRNPESVLKIAAVEHAADGARVRFPTVTGRAYRVNFREQLSAGSWSPLIDLAVTDASGRIQGDGTVKTARDAGAVAHPQRFYRVELLP